MGNSDTLGAWGREFGRLVHRFVTYRNVVFGANDIIILFRFENTITAQFYGHTHQDEFVVFYDPETNSRATNVAFITPSVATWTNLNPSFRIFTIDGDYEGSSRVSLRSLLAPSFQ